LTLDEAPEPCILGIAVPMMYEPIVMIRIVKQLKRMRTLVIWKAHKLWKTNSFSGEGKKLSNTSTRSSSEQMIKF
jgi:hypothetical protein